MGWESGKKWPEADTQGVIDEYVWGIDLGLGTDKTVVYVIQLTNEKSEMIVGVKPDGSIEFGPGFTTVDQASKTFWETLGKAYPVDTQNQGL
jgi:hypothetical protein